MNKRLLLFLCITVPLALIIVPHFCSKKKPLDPLGKNRQILRASEQQPTKIAIKKTQGKSTDTTITLKFTEVSNIYNYTIIDSFYYSKRSELDTIVRTILVYSKNNKPVDLLRPKVFMTPWYFPNNPYNLKLSRSFLTGHNANYDDLDDYFGEIVIADFNFDDKEDIATPVDAGADNGPHYAFYLQTGKRKFTLNYYLTENIVWCPTTFEASKKCFTTQVPAGVYGLAYTTFKWNQNRKTWSVSKHKVVDFKTGKELEK